ncbi:hypothetical protein AUJ77_02760 [Candidatus Nomurabacteria bacterium CG1_02_43_90]|uniref:Primosomal protein N n=1 Tax=Candidatus Nomurabacteria bacterium CG1_02_43_90 TaxID=1805281 RepID=A0A1J4V408_9BACT|nr:MAG: hypothetical protein AUJ77_02760 [Candidatus Nomurabacteria bacterium CG1_02_43_90]
MQIITVAPIVRGVPKEYLTYFSKEPLSVGMVILVPIRTREIPAIVIETKMAQNEKSTLKNSEYIVRKVSKTKPQHIWTPAFLSAIEHTANFSAQKIGETLLALTPKIILEAYMSGNLVAEEKVLSGSSSEVSAIQGNTHQRIESYRQLIRESFVRHESVFICLPTEDDVERIAKELGRGIEDYTFLFHGSVSSKRVLERWQKASKEKHAVLVVGTTQYLGIPRFFNTIILDEEHARTWKTMVCPLVDLRIFAEAYARANKSTIILGAPILRPETIERVRTKEITEFGRISAHTEAPTESANIIDPRKEEKEIRENTGRREFILFSTPVRELLEKGDHTHGHIFLLASRKGLAPVTSCGDCGTLVRCPECAAPLVIHKKTLDKKESQIFICHACGLMRTPEDNVHETCPQCGGWKLQGVGIGIDRIEAEVATLFPRLPCFVLDGDRAKTRTQAKKIIAEFEKSPRGILIATPMAIPLLDEVENTVVVSLDSLFAIPDIRMSERIFALILALREKTKSSLLVQTRADDTSLFEQALRGDLTAFTENELALRKAFFYPPYGTIIKITLRAPQEGIASEMEHLKTFLAPYAPIVTGTIGCEPLRSGNNSKKLFRMHLILKLAEGMWVDATLLAKLRALPAQFTTEVNPDHLL